MRTWKLEDAKNRFSELVRAALAHGPQRVTGNARNAVVVLNAEEYERLTVPADLVELLRRSPLAEALAAGELVLERDTELLDRETSL